MTNGSIFDALIQRADVAQMCCGCRCRLSTAFDVHIIVHKSPFEPAIDISLLCRDSGEPVQK